MIKKDINKIISFTYHNQNTLKDFYIKYHLSEQYGKTVSISPDNKKYISFPYEMFAEIVSFINSENNISNTEEKRDERDESDFSKISESPIYKQERKPRGANKKKKNSNGDPDEINIPSIDDIPKEVEKPSYYADREQVLAMSNVALEIPEIDSGDKEDDEPKKQELKSESLDIPKIKKQEENEEDIVEMNNTDNIQDVISKSIKKINRNA